MACDYLAVMASSVASERAFSSAGIMISRCRNRLNAHIIEALQCLKSLKGQDLMSRVSPNVADEEQLLDNADRQLINQEGCAKEVVQLVEDAEGWMFEADEGLEPEDADDKDELRNDIDT
jgi:hypothetical protein